MKKQRNCSKLKLKNSLLESVTRNDDALDYIQNQIYKTENVLGIDPLDKEVQKQLENEKYIKFALNYLDKMYTDSLKKLGVRL